MHLNFGFVLDHSGSMRGAQDRAAASRPCRLALAKMTPDDQVSVTVFNDSAKVIAERRAVRRSAAWRTKIARIRAGGGTQMSPRHEPGPARGLPAALTRSRVNQSCCSPTARPMATSSSACKLAKEAGEHKIADPGPGPGRRLERGAAGRDAPWPAAASRT